MVLTHCLLRDRGPPYQVPRHALDTCAHVVHVVHALSRTAEDHPRCLAESVPSVAAHARGRSGRRSQAQGPASSRRARTDRCDGPMDAGRRPTPADALSTIASSPTAAETSPTSGEQIGASACTLEPALPDAASRDIPFSYVKRRPRVMR
jgi:hypothetical protein